MEKNKIVVENPFIGRSDGVVFVGRRFDKPEDIDIIEYYDKDVVVKTGEGEDDYKIEKKLVEYNRVNRDKYIQSFSDEVGITNILKKVALGGVDVEQFKAKPGFVDMTQFPQGYGDAEKMLVDQRKEIWDSLPDELRTKMNYSDFVKDDSVVGIIQDYYDKLIAAKKAEAAAAQVKEGEE